jgi:hypothetical protein
MLLQLPVTRYQIRRSAEVVAGPVRGRNGTGCQELAAGVKPNDGRVASPATLCCDQYADSIPPLFQPGAGEEPAMQQQQRVQPEDDDKEGMAASVGGLALLRHPLPPP